MKVLVDAHVLDDLSQGSKTYLKGLYGALLPMATSHEFVMAVGAEGTMQKELGQHNHAKEKVLQSHSRLARLGWELSGMIRQEKARAAHFQYISPLVKRCAEVVTIHDVLFLDYPQFFPAGYRFTRNQLFKRSARRADVVLTVSAYSREAIARHYGLPEEKIVVTPNGILSDYFDPDIKKPVAGLQKGGFILYVSRFEPRKNHDGLLKAWRDSGASRRGVKLVLVGGEGIPSAEFQKGYQALSHEERAGVLFLKDLNLPELSWLYSSSALFVYPSFAEGFGIPPLEALAAGANVLCSGATAMKEFDFLGDQLFEPTHPGALTEKVKHFLDHPSLPSSQTLEKIRLTYSWENSARIMLQVLSRLA